MTRIFASVLLASAALGCIAAPTMADETGHAGYLASVATYKPMAGFNHVVGQTRFVGYFLPAPNACRVTLFEAAANDEALRAAPQRVVVDIGAGDRGEFGAGDGSALAIACTADADAIKIAPQKRTHLTEDFR